MFRFVVLSVLLVGCYANPFPEERIVNGTEAIVGKIPYIVSLRLNGAHTCGGSILDATHILTAAHCVYGMENELFEIQYGVLNIKETRNIIKVKKLIIHELYQAFGGYFNDIAILTLEDEIVLSETVVAVNLPVPNAATAEESMTTLAGWGLEKTGGSVQEHLQWVNLKIYSDYDCEKLHEFVTDRKYHICSGVPDGGLGQCAGDSGGPLYAYYEQVGIVSWSKRPCGIKGYPGVFTKVTNYVLWIREQLANDK